MVADRRRIVARPFADNRAMSFRSTRRIVFAIVLASFVLSFFHRTAPAAIAGELTHTFSINAAVLGTLAATYFYVYTVLQVPVGVLADTLGPRKLLAGGSLIAAAGSLVFALATGWEFAAAGRTLAGVGVSVAFISILKISAVWFAPNRFATLNGLTMFAGNLGAVIAGAPLAWIVAKEVNRPEHSGIATSVVNVGIFLGTGILQPLVGWVIDRGRATENVADAWDRAVVLMAAAAAFGALCTWFVREPSHA
jgi:MFS family permease